MEMEDLIDFYLLQLPPSYSMDNRNISRLLDFIEKTGIKERIAVEFRHPSWFNEETVRLGEENGFVIVSFDAPIARWFVCSGNTLYLRLHGRTAWYNHEHSREELLEFINTIVNLGPERIYVFFNNNHWMMDNARMMLELLRNRVG